MKTTERFSDRVANYLSFRPSYPAALIDTLTKECALTEDSVIADIGSGTGKLTELLLARELNVVGVEPNTEMREAAERLFRDNKKFTSIAGESTTTGLEAHSVDLITAAQAFHWFEPDSTKKEFRRILKPEGRVALIWNKRNTSTPFQQQYHEMLSHNCPEYLKVNHHNITDSTLEEFFYPGVFRLSTFEYMQRFELQGFLGRMCSSSYTPKAGTAEYSSLIKAAEQLFNAHENEGVVEFAYETRLYLSSL